MGDSRAPKVVEKWTTLPVTERPSEVFNAALIEAVVDPLSAKIESILVLNVSE